MSQKTKNRNTIWSHNPTPGCLSRENHDSPRRMYSVVLWSTAYKGQGMETTSVSIDKRVDQDVYIYTMGYYSAVKDNGIITFWATWVDLDIIMLSELSHKMRLQDQFLSLTCGIWQKYRLNYIAEQVLTHRHWNTYGLQRRECGGGGICLCSGIVIIWNWSFYDHFTTTDVIN